MKLESELLDDRLSFSWSSSCDSRADWWPLYVWVHDVMRNIYCCVRMTTCSMKSCAGLESFVSYCSYSPGRVLRFLVRLMSGISYCSSCHGSCLEPLKAKDHKNYLLAFEKWKYSPFGIGHHRCRFATTREQPNRR